MPSLDEFFLTDIAHQSDLLQKTDSGDLEIVSGLDNVKEALFRRLATEPGTLVHRPDYGVGIKQFQNAPATLATKRSLALRITEQFSQDSRVEKVLGILITNDDYKSDNFNVLVRVKLIGYGEQSLSFTPFGEVP
jgi:hypothetical protein